MNIVISPGNSKLGKIPNISFTPIEACKPNVPCIKECYALKSYRQYKNVRTAWDNNFKLYKLDKIGFFNDIHYYLAKHNPRFFRWHVAGDIQDQDYMDNMVLLANNHKKTNFLAFTKQYDLDYSSIPNNLSIVLSVWPGYEMPVKQSYKLPIAFMQDGSETRVFNTIECPGNCESCGKCFQLARLKKNVVFYKH